VLGQTKCSYAFFLLVILYERRIILALKIQQKQLIKIDISL